jgi:hypothetical protein
MKTFLILFFAVLSLAQAKIPFEPSDPQMQHFLIGDWLGSANANIYVKDHYETVMVTYQLSFYDNGTFKKSMAFSSSTGQWWSLYEGTWSVSDHLLHIIYTNISHPQVDNKTLDLLGDGRQWLLPDPYNVLPPPEDAAIHFLDKNTVQAPDGTVFRKIS